jgi:hypothetical protein
MLRELLRRNKTITELSLLKMPGSNAATLRQVFTSAQQYCLTAIFSDVI